jgi:uncharacterized protein
MIDSKMLDILACPACRGDVEYDAKNEKLVCIECSREFLVKDGIPIMVFEKEDQPAEDQ